MLKKTSARGFPQVQGDLSGSMPFVLITGAAASDASNALDAAIDPDYHENMSHGGLHVALAAVRSYLNRIPDGHLMPAINDPIAAMRCEG